MPSTSRQIAQLRATLDKLNEYVPGKEDFLLEQHDASSSSSFANDHSTSRRFQELKQAYLNKRLGQTFMDAVGSYDGENFTEPPNQVTPEQLQAVKEELAARKSELLTTLAATDADIRAFRAYHQTFSSRRTELQNMISELENSNDNNSVDMDGDNDDDDDDVEEADLEYQQERLASLQQREQELLEELNRIQAQTRDKQEQLQEQKRSTKRSILPKNAQESAAKMLLQAKEYDNMAAWYRQITKFMEEVAGIRLVSIEDAMEKENKAIRLTLELAFQHQVSILYAPSGRNNTALRVASASYLGDTTLTYELSLEEDSDKVSKAQLVLPPLDDLVTIAQQCQAPPEDLKFVVREANARILTLTARVEELAGLRAKYVCKIEPLTSNGSQDLYMSLNSGITAKFHLTPDCPLNKNSVMMEELIGVGGWPTEVLQKIKQDLTKNYGFASPLEAMTVLEEMLAPHAANMPGTPNMPSRSNARVE